MNLNILKPRKAVKDALEKPNMTVALALILLPSVAFVLISLIYGFGINAFATLSSIVFNYIRFFVIALVFYLVAFVIKGKEVGGKFTGIFSALSLIWILILIITLVFGFAMPMLVSKNTMSLLQDATNGKISVQQFAERVVLESANEKAVNWAGIFIMAALFFAFLVYAIILYYLAVSEVFRLGLIGNLVIWFILLIVIALIPI